MKKIWKIITPILGLSTICPLITITSCGNKPTPEPEDEHFFEMKDDLSYSFEFGRVFVFAPKSGVKLDVTLSAQLISFKSGSTDLTNSYKVKVEQNDNLVYVTLKTINSSTIAAGSYSYSFKLIQKGSSSFEDTFSGDFKIENQEYEFKFRGWSLSPDQSPTDESKDGIFQLSGQNKFYIWFKEANEKVVPKNLKITDAQFKTTDSGSEQEVPQNVLSFARNGDNVVYTTKDDNKLIFEVNVGSEGNTNIQHLGLKIKTYESEEEMGPFDYKIKFDCNSFSFLNSINQTNWLEYPTSVTINNNNLVITANRSTGSGGFSNPFKVGSLTINGGGGARTYSNIIENVEVSAPNPEQPVVITIHHIDGFDWPSEATFLYFKLYFMGNGSIPCYEDIFFSTATKLTGTDLCYHNLQNVELLTSGDQQGNLEFSFESANDIAGEQFIWDLKINNKLVANWGGWNYVSGSADPEKYILSSNPGVPFPTEEINSVSFKIFFKTTSEHTTHPNEQCYQELSWSKE